MISVFNLWKYYKTLSGNKYVARNLNLEFSDHGCVAILGANGTGKSTLLRMIAGIEHANQGEIYKTGSISWPIGYASSCHPDLTGAQNVRFVARVYGVDADSLIDYVRDFSQIGDHFYSPFRTYSSGMKSRISFGIAMGMNFDTYLLDEVTAVGDLQFKERSREVLYDRLSSRSAILVTHSLGIVKDLCTSVIVMNNGKARTFPDVKEGVAEHKLIMNGAKPSWIL